MVRNIFAFIFASHLVLGCTTRGPVVDGEVKTEPNRKQVSKSSSNKLSRPPSEPPIDPQDVARALKIVPSRLPLGHRAYKFQPCAIGVQKYNCKSKYLNVVKLKVFCRDSEGTVEYVSESDFTPLFSQMVEWRMGSSRGNARTDSQGQATLLSVTSENPKYSRFVLMHGKHSLRLRTNQVSRIVVPKYWCY